MEVVLEDNKRGEIRCKIIVSILLFVEVVLEELLSVSIQLTSFGFNPTFRGSRSGRGFLSRLHTRNAGVSILLFVEVVLEG